MTPVLPSDSQDKLIDSSHLTPLGQGRTAEVFRYGADRVVKLFRASFPLPAIENEYNVCRAIGSLIQIPKAHDRLVLDGREAIVFDFVEGVSGFRYLLRNPWRLKEFAIDFAAIHARMHAITVPETVPVLKSILIRNMNLHDLLPPETKERIIEYLGVLPDGNALCHGDYHPDNLLLQGRTPFVLDWMTATRGNPLADVARTVILLKWAQPGPGTPLLARTMLGAIRQRFCQHYLTHYRGLTGARMDEIDRWELPVLAARLMEWIPKSEKKLFVSIIAEKLKQI